MKYLILLCLVALVQSKKFWRQCKGNTGEVLDLQVEHCEHGPAPHTRYCPLFKGKDTTIKMRFTTPVDIQNLGVKMKGKIGLFWVPFPGGPTEGCDEKGAKCPLKAGGTYTFEKKVHISPSYPDISLLISVSMYDDDQNQVACVLLPVQLK